MACLHGALIPYPQRYLPAVWQPDEEGRAGTQGITLDVTLRCRPATLIRSRTRCGQAADLPLCCSQHPRGVPHMDWGALVARCALHARALLLGCPAAGACSMIQCRRVHAGIGMAACARSDLRWRARRALPTRDGKRLAQRILKLRAACDNVWAVITLNGCLLEQVRACVRL